MKKSLLILCLVAFLSGTAWAQIDVIPDLQQEISIGYGFRPASGFQGRSPWYYYQTIDKVGAIYGTYTYHINGEIGVGLTYCYDPRRLCYFTDKAHENPVCELDESSHTVMLHVKSNWLNKKWFSLYSKAGFGMAFWKYNLIEYHSDMYEIRLPYQNSCFACQLVPIGIEVGSERFAGFFQVGIGMEGFLSAGLRFRF